MIYASMRVGLVFTWLALESCLGFQDSCSADTWGLADDAASSKLYAQVDLTELQTGMRKEQISSIPNFVLNWYPDQEAFQDYKGFDLNPSRHYEYKAERSDDLTYWRDNVVPWNGENGPKNFRNATLDSGEIKHEDGSFTRVQRVGPLVSTGGYDYWQFGWKDVLGMSEVLERHPEGILFDVAFSSAVDEDGTPLGYPPIHMHHFHIGPHIGPKAKEPSEPFLAVEQHGDYSCNPDDGGVFCLFERSPDGYGKIFKTWLGLEGELNDARAANSTPMTWWYQVALRYRLAPVEGVTPYSQIFVVGPGPFTMNRQLSALAVFDSPTDDESFYWYSGTMPEDGKLLRNKLHSHEVNFERGWFIRASPEDLGLTEPRLTLPFHEEGCMGSYEHVTGCIPIKIHEAGFTSSTELLNHIFSNLANASHRHDASCLSLPEEKRSKCANQKPREVCHAWANQASIQDPKSGNFYKYDRRAPACCKPWTFHKGDVFTVFGTYKKVTQLPSPTISSIPSTIPMHLHWVTTFVPTTASPSYYFGDSEFEHHTSFAEHHFQKKGLPVRHRLFGRYLVDGKGNPIYRPAKQKRASNVAFLQANASVMPQAYFARGKGSIEDDKSIFPNETSRSEWLSLLAVLFATMFGSFCLHWCFGITLMGPSEDARRMAAKCCPPFPPKLVCKTVQYGTV